MAENNQPSAWMESYVEEMGMLRNACTAAGELIGLSLLRFGMRGAAPEVRADAQRWALAEVERQLIIAELDEMQAEVFLTDQTPDEQP